MPKASKPAKAKRGRPSKKPESLDRERVKQLTGWGLTQAQIAALYQIDEKTLRKHYTVELAQGKAEAISKVAATLFKMAISGESLSATIFYLKTQAGFSEKQFHEISGPDGGPIVFEDISVEKLKRLNPEELEAYHAIAKKLEDTQPEGH